MNLTVPTVIVLTLYMTIMFLGLFINGRHHNACSYTGPAVSNVASDTFF